MYQWMEFERIQFKYYYFVLGGAKDATDFGRSVNPISTGGQIMPTPGFSDLPTSLITMQYELKGVTTSNLNLIFLFLISIINEKTETLYEYSSFSI